MKDRNLRDPTEKEEKLERLVEKLVGRVVSTTSCSHVMTTNVYGAVEKGYISIDLGEQQDMDYDRVVSNLEDLITQEYE